MILIICLKKDLICFKILALKHGLLRIIEMAFPFTIIVLFVMLVRLLVRAVVVLERLATVDILNDSLAKILVPFLIYIKKQANK